MIIKVQPCFPHLRSVQNLGWLTNSHGNIWEVFIYIYTYYVIKHNQALSSMGTITIHWGNPYQHAELVSGPELVPGNPECFRLSLFSVNQRLILLLVQGLFSLSSGNIGLSSFCLLKDMFCQVKFNEALPYYILP